MPSAFTRIMAGELPARIVHEDSACIALLSESPLRPGHVMLVPRLEVDHWIDLPPALAAHLASVAQRLGKAMMAAFPCEKIGLAVIGLEVRHAHLHLVPLSSAADLDFSKQDRNPDAAMMNDAAARLREHLSAE